MSWPPSSSYDVKSGIRFVNRCMFTWRTFLTNFTPIWLFRTEPQLGRLGERCKLPIQSGSGQSPAIKRTVLASFFTSKESHSWAQFVVVGHVNVEVAFWLVYFMFVVKIWEGPNYWWSQGSKSWGDRSPTPTVVAPMAVVALLSMYLFFSAWLSLAVISLFSTAAPPILSLTANATVW